jgi:hypothetical protein
MDKMKITLALKNIQLKLKEMEAMSFHARHKGELQYISDQMEKMEVMLAIIGGQLEDIAEQLPESDEA